MQRRVTFLTDAPHQGVVVGHADDGALLVQLEGHDGPPSRFLAGEVTRLVLEDGAVAASAEAQQPEGGGADASLAAGGGRGARSSQVPDAR